jgi:hypothetical protein
VALKPESGQWTAIDELMDAFIGANTIEVSLISNQSALPTSVSGDRTATPTPTATHHNDARRRLTGSPDRGQ